MQDPVDKEALDGSIFDVAFQWFLDGCQCTLVQPGIEHSNTTKRSLVEGWLIFPLNRLNLVDVELHRDSDGTATFTSGSLGVAPSDIILVQKLIASVGRQTGAVEVSLRAAATGGALAVTLGK